MGANEILNLRQAFDEEQATALASFFDANLAAKADVEKVRADLTVEIEKVRADLLAQIESVRAKLKTDIAETKADLTKTILTVQVGGVISIGLMIALAWIFG